MAEPDFFARNNLPPSTKIRCHAFAANLYPASFITPAPAQGYCSYTLFLDPKVEPKTGQYASATGQEPLTVLQFRPPAYALDIAITDRARTVYGSLAPRVVHIGELTAAEDTDAAGRTVVPRADSAAVPDGSLQPLLRVYALSRVSGSSLADPRPGDFPYPASQARVDLVRSFAGFVARGWAHRRSPSEPIPRGLVGSSLQNRLGKMHAKLPARFRDVVARVLDALEGIEALPWVLTHGDVVPSNVMVRWEGGGSADGGVKVGGDEVTRLPRLEISGMLDWAEAEYLPFGVGLYGLEELLTESVGVNECGSDDVLGSEGGGEEGTLAGAGSGRYPPANSTFVYYPDAEDLRAEFWAELARFIPALGTGADGNNGGIAKKQAFLDDVDLARQLGILLWHGIAFDDGRLDRVVEEGRDDEEVRRLDLFLLGSGGGIGAESCYKDEGARGSNQDILLDPAGSSNSVDADGVDLSRTRAGGHHGHVWWSKWWWQTGGKPLLPRITDAWLFLTRVVNCVLFKTVR